MSQPQLYIFAISHYCEKARWALDHLGIDYKLKHLGPGFHRLIAQKLGASKSSVPMLVDGDTLIQGSDTIITWAEERSAKSFSPEGKLDDCLAIEKRLDATLGVHVRRCYYSEALVEHPKTVRPVLMKNIPLVQKPLVLWKWDLIRELMIKGMDLGAEQQQESWQIVGAELDWIESLLADGRSYLVGDSFSRADLTLASLLAPLANPAEHPTYKGLALPPRLADMVAEWDDCPAFTWLRGIYAKHR